MSFPDSTSGTDGVRPSPYMTRSGFRRRRPFAVLFQLWFFSFSYS